MHLCNTQTILSLLAPILSLLASILSLLASVTTDFTRIKNGTHSENSDTQINVND